MTHDLWFGFVLGTYFGIFLTTIRAVIGWFWMDVLVWIRRKRR
jgi:hypothetical protein